MRTSSPLLAPYLRSDAQAELLAVLLGRPDQAHSIAELARLTGVPRSVAHKEVSRLVTGGVLVDQRVGRARLVRANPDYRLIEPLTQIITSTHGPVFILTSLLDGIPGIEQAYIYGSWAARHLGHGGPPPGDIDVLVVGDHIPRAELNEAAAAAEEKLRMPVDIVKVTPKAWAEGREPFIQTVHARPVVDLSVHDRRVHA